VPAQRILQPGVQFSIRASGRGLPNTTTLVGWTSQMGASTATATARAATATSQYWRQLVLLPHECRRTSCCPARRLGITGLARQFASAVEPRSHRPADAMERPEILTRMFAPRGRYWLPPVARDQRPDDRT
jgi:hypothetical protein